MRRTRAAERAHLPPRNLNNEFNNAADPIFRTPIAGMIEATLRLMTMPQNPELERVINLPKNAVEQLERQNPCPRFTVRDQGLLQQQYLK